MTDEIPHKPASAIARMPRAARGLLIAVGVLLVLWAALWLAVPPLLKWQAEEQLSRMLGRSVSIGRVTFAPWALAVTVRDLRIAAAAGGAEPQLQIGRLYADASASSLFRLAPVITALEIDEPRVRVARLDDGRYDIDDVLRRFAEPPGTPSGEPARFALYNLQLRGGQVLFDDRPAERRHALSGLQLSLPFLSNLPTYVDVKVEPRLAFQLNGSPFDSGAQATPFARSRHAALSLKVPDLDLAPWLAYVPRQAPVQPQRGFVSADLQVEFQLDAANRPQVVLRGRAGARDLALADAAGAPLVAWRRLEVGLDDVQPLAATLRFASITLDGAALQVRRDAQGAVNLLALGAPAGKAAAPAAQAPAASASAPAAAGPGAWRVSVQHVALTDARIDWRDATTRPAAALSVTGLDVAAGPLAYPFDAAVPLKVSGRLAGAGAEPATFKLDGSGTDRAARATLELGALDLALLAPYVAEHLTAPVNGRATLQAGLDWAAGDPPRTRLALHKLQLDDLRVGNAARLRGLSVADGSVDLLARDVQLGQVRLDRPALAVARKADGTLDVMAWLKAAPAAGSAPAAAAAQAPWRLQLRDFVLDGGQLRWRDEAVRKGVPPVALQADALKLAVQGFAWPGSQPAKLQFATRLAQVVAGKPSAAAARIEWKGQVSPEPLAARGDLLLDKVPLHAFTPYVDLGLHLDIERADASWRGAVAVQQGKAGVAASATGDAQLAGVRINARAEEGGDELLNWHSFTLRGVQVRLAPPARPSVDIAEVVLADFYSRLVITEQGRFNLRDVAAPPEGAASAPVASPPLATAPAASSVAPTPAGSAPLPVAVSVASTRIVNGKVDFTDRFIKPNYSAALSELNGSLDAFRADSPQMAALELRGRAAGTAALEISGSLNPVATPLALDIRAKATDLELAPLSPYAGRYAGYAIERGKLSMDVAYKIEPDGRLTASNQVVLNQLTFGEKVDSPDATKLPVQLALALLKDRNGVIDLNLPISGSVNDPQFSIFGIVLKIIGNLLVKALTAPFSLLAGGGSDDLSSVAFLPGTAALAPGAASAIDKVAKALNDRPALTMTVAGASDLAREGGAMQAAALEARLRAEQRRDQLRAGAAADGAASAPPLPPLSGEQRAALVKRVYGDTKLPDKPRNLIGLAKDIPTSEMEMRLKDALPVSADTARELALQRGLAVRDALVARGLPSDRLFLAAPRLGAPADAGTDWTPSVQLTLSTSR